MSGLLRTPAAATAGTAPDTGRGASITAVRSESLLMRLVAFSALGGFAAAHWGGFVVNPPVGRTLLVLVVATGGAAALGLLDRVALPRPAVHALAAVVALVTLALGLMAAGLPGRLLLPASWGELFDGLDRGLAGAQSVDWPYGGTDPWIRLTTLLGAPALLTIGAVLAFWPARRAAPVLRERDWSRCCSCTHGPSPSATPASRPCAGSCCSCSWGHGSGSRGCLAARRSSPAPS